MSTIELRVEQDHVESLATVSNPLLAVEELVWNSLDADATIVKVALELNAMGGLEIVAVSDNGTGIPRSLCDSAFGTIGGSLKRNQKATPAGRIPHGRFGKGRLRSFGVGDRVRWLSRYRDNGSVREFSIEAQRIALKRFEVSDEREAVEGASTGVTATISGISKNFSALLDVDSATEELSRRLAIYLRKYPDAKVYYEKHHVDPAAIEAHAATYEIAAPGDSSELLELTVIEWNRKFDRKIYLCNADGFALEEIAPAIQAPGFDFTAYLRGPLVSQLVEEAAFAATEIHPVAGPLLERTREALRGHFRQRKSELAKDLVQQWYEEDIYPYHRGHLDPVKTIEREVFDVCALTINEFLPSFDRSEKQNKKLTFRLVKEALESDPGSLQKIIREVLALPQEQQEELASILDRTQLSAILSASQLVLDRLDFLQALNDLVFGEYKKTLLERSQLHRILAEELWVFGEQYQMGVDDQGLRAVLEKHIEVLERTDLAPESVADVKDLDGKQGIVDLMLYRCMPQLKQDEFEHLVIELKRPSCKLGEKELTQIKKYAFAVADDERFDTSRTRWSFFIIGCDLDKYASREADVQGREYGHIHASGDGKVNVFVKKWSAIISDAKWRYQFFRDRLQVDVKSAHGLDYLRRKHSERLPENAVEC